MRISDWSSDVCSSDLQVPIFHDAAPYRQRNKIKICSTGSRTGAASTPDTIALPTPSCLPSASLQPSSSGSINEMGWLPPSLTASQCAKNVVLSRSEEHTSELQSLMRISYAVFCLKKKILTERTRKSQY